MFAVATGFLDVIHQIATPIQLVALALVVMYALFVQLAKHGHVTPELAKYSFYLLLIAVTCAFAVVALPIIIPLFTNSTPKLNGNVEDKDNQQIGVLADVILQVPGSSTRHAHANDDGDFAFGLEQSDFGKKGMIWAVPLDKSKYGPSTSLPLTFAKDELHPAITLSVPELVKTTVIPDALKPAADNPMVANAHANPVQPVPSKDLQVPSHFFFMYPFQPQPGRRDWTRWSESKWNETYSDGTYTNFSEVSRASVDGCDGTVVARQPDTSFQVFIPDKNCGLLWTRFRQDNGNWNWLGEMQGIE